MSRNLFAKKPLRVLLEETSGENRLHRILGPVQLTSLGVGAIIGTGIFVLTGVAAHDKTGPALMLSFVVAGIACIFSALCYAEFASMAPVAGSAYTYAYVTMGELFAWIIGWDLVLEYAVGAATVANGWSQYLQTVLKKASIIVPFALSGAPVVYEEGVVLPNVQAVYETVQVKQKVVKMTDEEKKKGEPDHAVFWVNKETSARIGKVGDAAVEAKITERERAFVDLPAVLVVAIVTM